MERRWWGIGEQLEGEWMAIAFLRLDYSHHSIPSEAPDGIRIFGIKNARSKRASLGGGCP